MSAASCSTYTKTALVTCRIEARATDLEADAERGVRAAAAAFDKLAFSRPLAVLREEYRAVLEGEMDIGLDAHETEFGRMLADLERIADRAATEGWHDPEGAAVFIDVEPR